MDVIENISGNYQISPMFNSFATKISTKNQHKRKYAKNTV